MNSYKYLTICRSPSEQVIGLLEANAIGTPGKSMVYKHARVEEKVKAVPNPYFANLCIRNRLYGTICLSKRTIFNCGVPREAFYLRYFTFRESVRSFDPDSRKSNKTSPLRDEISALLDGHGLAYSGELLLYAYVDADNVRSERLIKEFGFHKVGDFQLVPFSRIFTKHHLAVKIADEKIRHRIKEQLHQAHQHQQLVSYEFLFLHGKYFYIEENNEMVCGVQAIPDTWLVKELPGWMGKILLRVVPGIPLLRRLFDPEYQFVFLEAVFCLPGHESKLSVLFQSALHHFGRHSAVLCVDRRAKIYSQIKQNNLGLTHKLQGEKTIDIVVKTSRSQSISSDIPFNISGYDVL
ncbi:MAG: hypothetical protein HC819_15870 [Cyclobacteriaceae bacterium]|nr:hypothetical protein [Cyclobacteriaceae bacterium]